MRFGAGSLFGEAEVQLFLPTTEQEQTVHAALSSLRERMLHPHVVLHVDIDHTIIDRGIKLTPDERIFDPDQYKDETGNSMELENIDLLVILALHGVALSVETGKDANAWPLATYIKKRIDMIAQLFGLPANDQRPEDTEEEYFYRGGGPRKTIDGTKPVLFTFTTGNGGFTIDLSSNYALRNESAPNWPPSGCIIYKPIPLSTWEWLQKHEDLLRDSTKESRIAQLTGTTKRIQLSDVPGDELATNRLPPRIPYNPKDDPYVTTREQDRKLFVNRVISVLNRVLKLKLREKSTIFHTDQLHKRKTMQIIDSPDALQREVELQLTEIELEHRRQLQASIRDFVSSTPWSTKANLVLDLEKIVGRNGDTSLQKRWYDETGVLIVDESSLLEAFGKLSEGQVNFFRSHAHQTVYIDIAAPKINKRENARLVKNFVQGMYRLLNVPFEKVYTLALGDAPHVGTNDNPLIVNTGGVTNTSDLSGKIRSEKGWPIYLQDLLGKGDEITLTNHFLRMMMFGRLLLDDQRMSIFEQFLKYLAQTR